MSFRVICGDALAVLREMPACSVQCCVTSPPYWGLRDYGIPASVWGGDPRHIHRGRWRRSRPAPTLPDSTGAGTAHGYRRGEEQPIEKRPGWKRHFVAQGNFV